MSQYRNRSVPGISQFQDNRLRYRARVGNDAKRVQSALCTMDDANCFHMIRLKLKRSANDMNVVDVRSAAGCCHLFPFLWSRHGCSRTRCHPLYPRSIRAATAAVDLLPRFLLTRLSPAFPGALAAPRDFRDTPRFTAPLPCCECT